MLMQTRGPWLPEMVVNLWHTWHSRLYVYWKLQMVLYYCPQRIMKRFINNTAKYHKCQKVFISSWEIIYKIKRIGSFLVNGSLLYTQLIGGWLWHSTSLFSIHIMHSHLRVTVYSNWMMVDRMNGSYLVWGSLITCAHWLLRINFFREGKTSFL